MGKKTLIMTGPIRNGPWSSQKMNSQSSHSNTWWLGGHHLLVSLSLKGRANEYISLKGNHGYESAFLCHLFSECRVFSPRESNYNSMRTHERAENWGDTAGIGCLWCSGYIGANVGVHCTNGHQVYVLDRSPSSFVVGFKASFALWKLVSLCKSNLPL